MDKPCSWGWWRAEGPGGDRVVTMGHHLPKLTGRRAPLSLANESADPRKIKKESWRSWGCLQKSVGHGNKDSVKLENKVWLGNSSQRAVSKAGAGVGRKPERLLNNSICSRKISACSEGESFKSTYTLSPDAAQIFLFKEVCDPDNRLKSDLYNTKEIPESRTPLRPSEAY